LSSSRALVSPVGAPFPGTSPHAEPTVCCNYKCVSMKLLSEARKTKFVAYTGQFGQAIISIKSH
jgi:hypothetical protein